MPNKIQIKYGKGEPPKTSLDRAELGFDNENKKLYIGTGEEEYFLINKIVGIGEEPSENFMSKIQYLFLDNQNNEVLYPYTKVEAVSDNNGNKLASLLNSKQNQHLTLTATLLASSWQNNQQTVTVNGANGTNTIIVTSAPENIEDYTSDGVYCLGQSENKLTFACVSVPKKNLIANIMILN